MRPWGEGGVDPREEADFRLGHAREGRQFEVGKVVLER